MNEAGTIRMLVALSAATFVVTSSGSATAPFMQVIATDLSTGLPAIAHLFSVQAATWGIASLVAGTLSDRLGRRAILVGAVILLGATRLGFASAGDYASAITWQAVSGIGGGAFMGTVFAAVSDNIPAGARGRALSWIVTGQSLSLVLGVPVVTLLGTFGGWRGALAAHGVATILMAVAVRFATPADVRHDAAHKQKASWRLLLQTKFLALLAAGTTERMCFATLAIYLPTYLQMSYGVSFAALALALALVALGSLAGNVLGGRIADRTRSRMRVFAIASLATAGLALPTLMWQPGLAASVALGFAYSLVNASGRPALLATLSEVPSELRGALFGLNVTMASVGWLLAGSVGGLLVAGSGFDGVGLLCAGMALAGALLALAARHAARGLSAAPVRR
jgi:MFS transporter, DHA1 family, inner membrane transport protein